MLLYTRAAAVFKMQLHASRTCQALSLATIPASPLPAEVHLMQNNLYSAEFQKVESDWLIGN